MVLSRIPMKGTDTLQGVVHVVLLFIAVLYKVALMFESVDKFLKFNPA